MSTLTGTGHADAAAGAEALQAASRDFRGGRLASAAAHAQTLAAVADLRLRADAATLLARITRRQGLLDLALAASGRAMQAAATAADPARECRARAQHAHALNALGLIEPALEESYAALRLAELSGQSVCEAAATEALAGVQWSMSHWAEARAGFQRMLEIAVAVGELELQMIACGGLGGAENQLARLAPPAERHASLDRARRHALSYLELATRLGDAHAMRAARHNHAVTLSALGEHGAARAALEAVLAEATDVDTRALSLGNLADLDLQAGDPAAAVQRLEAAHAMLDTAEDVAYLMSCCHTLSQAHEALGDTRAALSWHRRYHEHYVRVASEKAQMHARALAVKYETGRAQAVATFERLRAQRFERDALEDSLTGIANRRAFDLMLAQAIEAGLQGRPFGLALFDIDHFKHINDSHSHLVGDEVLRRVAQILAANSRRDDLAARYGGEEFAIVLAGSGTEALRQACERVRRAVEGEDWSRIASGLEVRISAGCMHVDTAAAAQGAEALLARADRRLYAAKAAGRNRVIAEDSAT